MSAIDGLCLGGRVPPGVGDEAVVGRGEIESEAAGFEADQEDLGLSGGELLDLVLAPTGAHGPVEVAERDPGADQRVGDQRQETGEAAEHQRAVSLVEQYREAFGQVGDLGRRDRGMLIVDQSGMQAELTHPGECLEDLHPVVLPIVQQSEDLLAFAGEEDVVDLAVCGVEVEPDDGFLLRRQVVGDLILGAPQHDRLEPPAQDPQPLGIGAVLDRYREVLAELLRAAVQAGRDERDQRPQLHHVVLHRRTGDGELERCGQPPGGLVRLGVMILDELRLVEDRAVPGDLDERVVVDPEQRVRRDDDVRVADLLGERRPAALLGRGDGGDAQARREPPGLGGPVADDAGRCHHQEARLRPLLRDAGDQRQRLDGLAEAHVVGQDPAEPVVPEEAQPGETVALVAPQGRGEPGGGLDRAGWTRVCEPRHLPVPLRELLGDHAEAEQFVPHGGVGMGGVHLRAVEIAQSAGLEQQVAQAVQLRGAQIEVAAAGEHRIALAVHQVFDDRGDRDQFAVDLDLDVQVEPFVRAAGAEVQHRVGHLAEVLVLAGDLDLDQTGRGDPVDQFAAQDRGVGQVEAERDQQIGDRCFRGHHLGRRGLGYTRTAPRRRSRPPFVREPGPGPVQTGEGVAPAAVADDEQFEFRSCPAPHLPFGLAVAKAGLALRDRRIEVAALAVHAVRGAPAGPRAVVLDLDAQQRERRGDLRGTQPGVGHGDVASGGERGQGRGEVVVVGGGDLDRIAGEQPGLHRGDGAERSQAQRGAAPDRGAGRRFAEDRDVVAVGGLVVECDLGGQVRPRVVRFDTVGDGEGIGELDALDLSGREQRQPGVDGAAQDLPEGGRSPRQLQLGG